MSVAFDVRFRDAAGRDWRWSAADSAISDEDNERMVRFAMAPWSNLSHALRHTWTAGLLLVAGLASAACTNSIEPPAVNQVAVLPAQDSVEVGSKVSHFVATALDAQGQELTGRRVTWRIMDSTVASVDANGVVTGLKIGVTRLVATIGGRPSNPIVIIVISKATRLLVIPDSLEVNVNSQKGINAAVFDAAGSPIPGRVVTWSSANPLVAAIAPGGAVTGISVGETIVNAVVGDSLRATVKVRVIPEKVASVRIIDPLTGSYILRITKSLQVVAQALNFQNVPLPNRVYTWHSTNPAVASVSTTGLVTGNLIGTATIVVECEGVVDQLQVQVTQIPVATVSILPNDPTFLVGQTSQLAAVVKDSAGNALTTTGRNVLWTNSNGTVASVTGGGVITALSPGTTSVQLIVDQIPSTPITVTVNQLPVVSVTVTPQTSQLKVGLVQQLQATPRDINGNPLNNRSITWASSDTTIATVAANGLVKAIAVGQAVITATSEGVDGTAVITVIP